MQTCKLAIFLNNSKSCVKDTVRVRNFIDIITKEPACTYLLNIFSPFVSNKISFVFNSVFYPNCFWVIVISSALLNSNGCHCCQYFEINLKAKNKIACSKIVELVVVVYSSSSIVVVV